VVAVWGSRNSLLISGHRGARDPSTRSCVDTPEGLRAFAQDRQLSARTIAQAATRAMPMVGRSNDLEQPAELVGSAGLASDDTRPNTIRPITPVTAEPRHRHRSQGQEIQLGKLGSGHERDHLSSGRPAAHATNDATLPMVDPGAIG
jgi:hypothetical protein